MLYSSSSLSVLSISVFSSDKIHLSITVSSHFWSCLMDYLSMSAYSTKKAYVLGSVPCFFCASSTAR